MKKPSEISGSELYDKILNETPKEDRLMVTKSLELAVQIIDILEEKRMLRKTFAELMGKNESEISKWLSGFHNFTISTLCKIEIVLGRTIITTPAAEKKKLSKDIDSLISRISENVNAFSRIKVNVKLNSLTTESQSAKLLKMQWEEFQFVEPDNSEEFKKLTGTYS